MRSLQENSAKMRLPSLAGEEVAQPIFWWVIVRPVAQNCRSQILEPSFALRQMTWSRF